MSCSVDLETIRTILNSLAEETGDNELAILLLQHEISDSGFLLHGRQLAQRTGNEVLRDLVTQIELLKRDVGFNVGDVQEDTKVWADSFADLCVDLDAEPARGLSADTPILVDTDDWSATTSVRLHIPSERHVSGSAAADTENVAASVGPTARDLLDGVAVLSRITSQDPDIDLALWNCSGSHSPAKPTDQYARVSGIIGPEPVPNSTFLGRSFNFLRFCVAGKGPCPLLDILTTHDPKDKLFLVKAMELAVSDDTLHACLAKLDENRFQRALVFEGLCIQCEGYPICQTINDQMKSWCFDYGKLYEYADIPEIRVMLQTGETVLMKALEKLDQTGPEGNKDSQLKRVRAMAQDWAKVVVNEMPHCIQKYVDDCDKDYVKNTLQQDNAEPNDQVQKLTTLARMDFEILAWLCKTVKVSCLVKSQSQLLHFCKELDNNFPTLFSKEVMPTIDTGVNPAAIPSVQNVYDEMKALSVYLTALENTPSAHVIGVFESSIDQPALGKGFIPDSQEPAAGLGQCNPTLTWGVSGSKKHVGRGKGKPKPARGVSGGKKRVGVVQGRPKPARDVQDIQKPVEDVKGNRKTVENVQGNQKPVEDVQVDEKHVDVQGNQKPVEDVQVDEKPVEDVQGNQKPVEDVQDSQKPFGDVKGNSRPALVAKDNKKRIAFVQGIQKFARDMQGDERPEAQQQNEKEVAAKRPQSGQPPRERLGPRAMFKRQMTLEKMAVVNHLRPFFIQLHRYAEKAERFELVRDINLRWKDLGVEALEMLREQAASANNTHLARLVEYELAQLNICEQTWEAFYRYALKMDIEELRRSLDELRPNRTCCFFSLENYANNSKDSHLLEIISHSKRSFQRVHAELSRKRLLGKKDEDRQGNPDSGKRKYEENTLEYPNSYLKWLLFHLETLSYMTMDRRLHSLLQDSDISDRTFLKRLRVQAEQNEFLLSFLDEELELVTGVLENLKTFARENQKCHLQNFLEEQSAETFSFPQIRQLCLDTVDEQLFNMVLKVERALQVDMLKVVGNIEADVVLVGVKFLTKETTEVFEDVCSEALQREDSELMGHMWSIAESTKNEVLKVLLQEIVKQKLSLTPRIFLLARDIKNRVLEGLGMEAAYKASVILKVYNPPRRIPFHRCCNDKGEFTYEERQKALMACLVNQYLVLSEPSVSPDMPLLPLSYSP